MRAASSPSATSTRPGRGRPISPRRHKRRERPLTDDPLGDLLRGLARCEGADADAVAGASGRVHLDDVRLVARGGELCPQGVGGLLGPVRGDLDGERRLARRGLGRSRRRGCRDGVGLRRGFLPVTLLDPRRLGARRLLTRWLHAGGPGLRGRWRRRQRRGQLLIERERRGRLGRTRRLLRALGDDRDRRRRAGPGAPGHDAEREREAKYAEAADQKEGGGDAAAAAPRAPPRHYMLSGPPTPRSSTPFRTTVSTAAQRAIRACMRRASSWMTRWFRYQP